MADKEELAEDYGDQEEEAVSEQGYILQAPFLIT